MKIQFATRRDAVDMKGSKFGRLTVLGLAGRDKFPCGSTALRWRVRCEACGRVYTTSRRALRAAVLGVCRRCASTITCEQARAGKLRRAPPPVVEAKPPRALVVCDLWDVPHDRDQGGTACRNPRPVPVKPAASLKLDAAEAEAKIAALRRTIASALEDLAEMERRVNGLAGRLAA